MSDDKPLQTADVDMRRTIAAALAEGIQRGAPAVSVRQTETTSGCPVLELTLDGKQYNVTITRAR